MKMEGFALVTDDRQAMPEATSICDEGQTQVQQTNVPSNFLESRMCAMTDQVGYRLITDLILQSKFMTFST